MGERGGLVPLTIGLSTFAFLILLTSLTSSKYCNEKKDCLTIVPSKIEIPTGVWGSIAGAFSGAVFTYGIFNLLEIQKAKGEPKPKLLPSFDYRDKDCLVIDSDPHPIFLPLGESQLPAKQFVGSASYLRIKITNSGPVVCENARAYITDLLVYDISDSKYKRVERFKEPMALLWAFEKKYDLYDDGKGLDLQSQASRYADILVSYEKIFTPSHPRVSSSDDAENTLATKKLADSWFLKLKTVIQPTSHERMIEIPPNADVKYKIDITIFGDKALPQSISITLCHQRGESHILVKNETEERANNNREASKEVILSLHNSVSVWESEVSKDLVYQQL